MAFIVVKRQISRFAFRGAQKSIGSGAPKVNMQKVKEWQTVSLHNSLVFSDSYYFSVVIKNRGLLKFRYYFSLADWKKTFIYKISGKRSLKQW